MISKQDEMTYTRAFGQASDDLSRLDDRRKPLLRVPVTVHTTTELANTNDDRAKSGSLAGELEDALSNPLRLSVANTNGGSGVFDPLFRSRARSRVGWWVKISMRNNFRI